MTYNEGRLRILETLKSHGLDSAHLAWAEILRDVIEMNESSYNEGLELGREQGRNYERALANGADDALITYEDC